jgi:peroxiredoxin Q/BCP
MEGDKVPAKLLLAGFESIAPGADPPATRTLLELVPNGKTLVLFFYPKDSTPGCTREAQAFTARRAAVEKAGGVLVGVSRDSVKSHGAFRDKFGLAVTLFSDPARVLHEGFGAWGEKVMYGKKVLGAIRSTFLVKDGWVIRAWPSVKVDGHADQVLEALSGGGANPAKGKPAKEAPAKPAARKTEAKAPAAKAAKPATAKPAATKPAAKAGKPGDGKPGAAKPAATKPPAKPSAARRAKSGASANKPATKKKTSGR